MCDAYYRRISKHIADTIGIEAFQESANRFNQAYREVQDEVDGILFTNWIPGSIELSLSVSWEIHEDWKNHPEKYQKIKDIFEKYGFTLLGYSHDSYKTEEQKKKTRKALSNMGKTFEKRYVSNIKIDIKKGFE